MKTSRGYEKLIIKPRKKGNGAHRTAKNNLIND